MTKPEPETEYFNYHDYSNLKTDMNPPYPFPNDYSSDIKDTAEKLSINRSYKLKDFIDTLIKYNFYLYRGHAFIRNDNDNCCRYINYWINDQFRNTDFNVNEHNFKYLKEYVEKLVNFNNNNKPHHCYRFTEYINSDMFLKLQKLYHLYDKYYGALENLKNKPKFCSDFHNLTRLYNDFINNTYKEKTKLYSNRLKDLERRINKTKENDTSTCTGYSFYVSSLQIDPPPQLESPVQVQPQAPATLSPEPLESTRLTSSYTGDHVQKQSEDEEAPILENVQEDLSSSGLPKGPEFLHVPENLTVQRFSQELNETELDDHSERPLHPELSAYGRALFQVPTEQQESEGFLKQARSAISGIIGEVNPIPVVGVSGGMGALFLLFRYTPVGTFFRGGRGRAHRIPRSFNGQFPGFPDYYDYDGGYIGYAPMNINPLAE
ncbi:Plasmodium vivax Vir protein, putative [Plasmodium vivax]|uniref:Vir protein, putative n=1 Tax=Plasmodium vivax TaxID=5855 RepID=A0A1G4E3H0_PLAVI|nr:Plasmodium vivax Vir protein, putative [Plasmodium vivax]